MHDAADDQRPARRRARAARAPGARRRRRGRRRGRRPDRHPERQASGGPRASSRARCSIRATSSSGGSTPRPARAIPFSATTSTGASSWSARKGSNPASPRRCSRISGSRAQRISSAAFARGKPPGCRFLRIAQVASSRARGAPSAAACLRACFFACFATRRSISLRSRLSFAIVVFFLPLEAMPVPPPCARRDAERAARQRAAETRGTASVGRAPDRRGSV